MLEMLKGLFGPKQPATPAQPARDSGSLTALLAAPAIHVLTAENPSLSYFGGDPQLPADASWPSFEGRKLDFLARISLAGLQRTQPVPWLPDTGALLFFYDMVGQPWGYDPKERGRSAVLHVADLLTPASVTSSMEPRAQDGIRPRNIAFKAIRVLPSQERPAVEELDLSDEEADDYYEVRDAVFDGKPIHQIGGFPSPVQGDSMEFECELVSNGVYCGDSSAYKDSRAKALEPNAASWRLLFQIDSDDALEVMWGDSGTLYFWVKENQSREGDFSNAWVVLQCS